MSDFLSGYSIQRWLESCPQGYLEKTEFGHAPGESEPELLLANPTLREDTLRTTVQLGGKSVPISLRVQAGESA